MRFLPLAVLIACDPPTPTPTPSPTSTPTPTAMPTPTPIPVRVRVEGEPRLCASPGARADKALDYQRLEGTGVHERLFAGSGLVLADFDGDGDLDLFAPGATRSQLWRRVGPDTWSESRLEFTADIDLDGAVGGSAADYDSDGDLDLVVTRDGFPNVLLNNQGNGTFVDATLSAGLVPLAARTVSSTWADLDNDGDLDLLLGNYGARPGDAYDPAMEPGDPSELYINNGNGTFTPMPGLLPSRIHDAHVFMFAVNDVNQDGYPEVFSVHDFGWIRPSTLLWNVGGQLVPDDGTAGFHPSFAGMGIGMGDINGDGKVDFLQSSWRALSLLESFENPAATQGWTWAEFSQARQLGLTDNGNQIFGWGAELADLDNDGDLDAAVVYGKWDDYQDAERQHDGLWLQNDDGMFEQFANHEAWAFDDRGPGRALLAVDLNDDGWLDLAKREVGGATKLYRSRCGVGHWVRIRLRDETGPNGFAIGGSVQVLSGTRTWTAWQGSGTTGMFSGGPPEMHVGLGEAAAIDTIRITWPDGAQDTVDALGVDQILTLTRQIR